MGKTKVFLKYWHVDKLNELLEKVHKAATILQSGMYQLALSSASLLLSGVKGGDGVTSIVTAATVAKAAQ